jgi:hypothetical protein
MGKQQYEAKRACQLRAGLYEGKLASMSSTAPVMRACIYRMWVEVAWCYRVFW